MGIGLEQWRAKIGLWHAFTTGRPLVRRRRCKPLRGRSGRRHECKRAFKARQKGRQKTEVRFQFLSFVAMLTLLAVVDSRINTLNNLSCRLTSTRFYPAIRLAATLYLVGSNKYGSMDKLRNTGMEPRSLISQHSVMTVLAMLLILAGDVEVNPGPFKLGKHAVYTRNSVCLDSSCKELTCCCSFGK